MLLLGLDIGTSSTKALVADGEGRVLGAASAEHDVSTPRIGWSEQDPAQWWRATGEATRRAAAEARIDAREIAAVGLSGQMHGLVLLDAKAAESNGESGSVLRPAILWNDQRTAAQCEAIEAAVGGRRRLVELAGNAALPGFTLPKILWVREHEPEVFAMARLVLTPKDWVRFRLTGEAVIDVGDASGTLLFDVDRRSWSRAVAESMGVDLSLLPRAVESCEIVGEVTVSAATSVGLRAGTPVIAGSGDNMAGAIGAGVVEPGMVLATLGTSGVLYAHSERPRRDLGKPPGRLHTMCAADGTSERAGQWCVTGCMLSAAGALQWVRDRLFPEATFERLVAEAETASPGCEGLVFLPYLTGERCPHPDPAARGGWIGLTARHGRAHLLRSVVEGVTFGMGEILVLMRAAGVGVERIRLGGGGAKSRFWRQVQADVYGQAVALPNTTEGPALGAAMMAGVGVGVWQDVREAARAIISDTETIEPSGADYAGAREAYARLYHNLRGHFAGLER